MSICPDLLSRGHPAGRNLPRDITEQPHGLETYGTVSSPSSAVPSSAVPKSNRWQPMQVQTGTSAWKLAGQWQGTRQQQQPPTSRGWQPAQVAILVPAEPDAWPNKVLLDAGLGIGGSKYRETTLSQTFRKIPTWGTTYLEIVLLDTWPPLSVL